MDTTSMAPRWMLYSYDALGLGHVRRMLAIARAAAGARPDASGLLFTCSPMVDALPIPAGLDYIKLPSARKLGNGHYVARSLGVEPADLLAIRADVLTHAARAFAPDLLLVDKMPLGLMGELARTLDALADNRTFRILGWRDILDAPDRVANEWSATPLVDLVRAHYDELWVFGDPDVFDVRREYELPDDIAERVRYTGYLTPPRPRDRKLWMHAHPELHDQPLAVVTAGGGEDGERVLAMYVEAAARGLLPRNVQSLVVTGPCMPRAAQGRLESAAPPGVTVRSFVPDLAPVISAADVVVGMAGYNTVSEWLAGNRPAVFLPRTHPRREQWIRASRLAERGLCECLDIDGTSPTHLADAVARALASPAHAGALPRTDGLTDVAEAIGDRLHTRHTDGATQHPNVRRVAAR